MFAQQTYELLLIALVSCLHSGKPVLAVSPHSLLTLQQKAVYTLLTTQQVDYTSQTDCLAVQVQYSKLALKLLIVVLQLYSALGFGADCKYTCVVYRLHHLIPC